MLSILAQSLAVAESPHTGKGIEAVLTICGSYGKALLPSFSIMFCGKTFVPVLKKVIYEVFDDVEKLFDDDMPIALLLMSYRTMVVSVPPIQPEKVYC